jgi:hypothetical protein
MSLENESFRYVENLNRLGIWTKEVSNFFTVREKCAEELLGMKKAVSKLQPVPEYRVYGGAVPLPEGVYLYHSGVYTTLVKTFLDMHVNNHEFSVDKKGQIVLARPNILVPKVEEYGSAIETADVFRLSEEHPGRKLFSHASILVIKVGGCWHYFDVFQRLLLCEGFGEDIGKIC